jgi:hypothetical protein
MPRIENDTPGGEKEGKKQISKRESAQREHFNVADRELCAKEIFFLKKREPQERKLPARAASQQKRKCPAKGQFFLFFCSGKSDISNKKKPKTLTEPPEVCGAVAIQKKKVKNNKREKRKYQKDYCTTRGVLCSKCNRRGRKGSEIKKQKSASYYITIQSHYSREF